jgi:thiamine-phosphate pyrophosphorylase
LIRYAITDCSQLATPNARRAHTLAAAKRWASQKIDIVQLREKNLDAGELYDLAKSILHVLRSAGASTQLLIHSRADIALATGAHGVHLTSHPDELTPANVRALFAQADRKPIVSISCHTIADVERAHAAAADLILFGPVFEKRVNGLLVREGLGLDELCAASNAAASTPLLALGGITSANTALCINAGAAGIAGIRLFE